MNLSLLFLILTIGGAIASYFISQKNDKQIDSIEEVNKITNKLTTEIRTISENNSKVSDQIKNLSEINNSLEKENSNLSGQNIRLTTEVKSLIKKVEDLSKQSKVLIDKLDVKTDQEFAVTGSFDFSINLENAKTPIVFNSGGPGARYESSADVLHRNNGYMPNLIGGSREKFINIQIQKYKLVVNAFVYDYEGQLIAEIHDNNWRVNKNLCSKFNYDAQGFEIFDNSGRIALNVNIIGTEITVQGIKVDYPKFISFYYYEGMHLISFQEENYKLKAYNFYDTKAKITQLFDYTGHNWHGLRKK